MYRFLLVMFVLISIILIMLIMLQQNKVNKIKNYSGIGFSGSFLRKSAYSGNFITQVTTIFAIMFFVLSLILGNLNNNFAQKKNKWDNISQVNLKK